MHQPIEPYSELYRLSDDLKQVVAFRQLQAQLAASRDTQNQIRDQIFDGLGANAKLAMLPTRLFWRFDDFGGTLLVQYPGGNPLIARDQRLLTELLDLVKYLTGVLHVVVIGGVRPLVCHWNEFWICRVIHGGNP